MSSHHSAPGAAVHALLSYKREWYRRLCLLASSLANRRIIDLYLVTDLAGFTFAHRHGVPWVKGLSFIDKNFYPETAGGVIVVNAPGFFAIVYNLIKGFIDERTQAKVAILSSNYQTAVTSRLGAASTPVEWGGTCTHCDGHCLPVLLAADPAVERARQSTLVRALETPTWTTVPLPARASHDATFRVEGHEPAGPDGGGVVDHWLVWWSFKVEARDVDFGVEFVSVQGEKAQLVPVHRVSAGQGGGGEGGKDDGYVRGCYRVSVGAVNEGGEVRLTWSNAFSMFTGKQIEVQCGIKKE